MGERLGRRSGQRLTSAARRELSSVVPFGHSPEVTFSGPPEASLTDSDSICRGGLTAHAWRT